MTGLSVVAALSENSKFLKKELIFFHLSHTITVTEPNTPLNDADHVGSFDFVSDAQKKTRYCILLLARTTVLYFL